MGVVCWGHTQPPCESNTQWLAGAPAGHSTPQTFPGTQRNATLARAGQFTAPLTKVGKVRLGEAVQERDLPQTTRQVSSKIWGHVPSPLYPSTFYMNCHESLSENAG